jgi:hypothetical protein
MAFITIEQTNLVKKIADILIAANEKLAVAAASAL